MRYVLIVALFAAVPALGDDWPQWMGPKRDNVWRETGIVEKFPAGGPKVVWRARVAGGYSGPFNSLATGFQMYLGSSSSLSLCDSCP